MKKSIYLLINILLLFPLIMHAQNCYKSAWVKDFGGNSAYQSIIEADRRGDGKFVVLGSFSNAPLTLGTLTLPSTYGYNFFLAVHDSAGNFYNGAVIANGGYITKLDVGIDGSVCITGYWTGSIIVGPDTLPSASRNRIFVAKFDENLQFKWLRQSSWMSSDCYSYDVCTDLNKNVYICGTFQANAFKIGDVVVGNSGGWDMWTNEGYFVKFDSNGVTQYAKSFGSQNADVARSIVADSLGNIFVAGSTGKTTYTVKFGNQVGLPGSVADNSGFIAKYDAQTGDCLWAKMLGGFSTYDLLYTYDACLGENNSLIISGSITGTVSCPPYSYTASDQNAFVAKFSNDGLNEWLHQTGGQNSSEYGYYCTYHMGRIAVSGRLFSNTTYCADFPLYSTQNTSFDAFNAMFETSGKLIWARGNESNYFSDYYPEAVLIDDDGNQLYWGVYKGTQSWYPVTLTNSASYGKLFLARFAEYNPAPAFTVNAGPDKTSSCGTSVQLQASTTPTNIPFGWWPSLGFSANGVKNPSVNPGMPTYYVFYASYQGCVKSDTVFVDISNYNNFFIDAGPDQDLCGGDSIHLNVTSNQSGLSYSWTPIKYISSTTAQNPWVKPVLPMNYIVTATVGGCKDVDTVHVNQHGKPYIYLPKQDQYYGNWYRYHICEGTPIDINLGDPANTYSVNPSSLTSSINNNLITLHGNYPGGNLFVEASSPEGCFNKDSVEIVIHNNQSEPNILGSVPNRSACPGDTIQMTVWLTNSLQYNFQFSWYGGWQVDSMNGQGWKDISIWENSYDPTIYSSGYPNSTYYTRLRIPLINADMDGFRYRCYVNDYCSPRAYSNAGTLRIGPKLTVQPPVSKILCQNHSDSISVNSTSANVQYNWEILQSGSWIPVVAQAGVISPNGRYLSFYNPQPNFDSTWVRCGLNGCNETGMIYSNPSLIRVVPIPAVVWQTAYDTICPGTPDSLMVTPNSNLFTINWYANNVAITSNNSQISGYNTTKLKFNPVFSAQNNIDYKLKMTHLQCGFTAFSDTTGFRVIQVPTVSWPGNMIMTCVNATPITLTGATPPGGTYSGPGVSGNIFDPTIAGPGAHILTYTVNSSTPGCNASALKSVWVQDLPTVTWPGGDLFFCTTSPQYHLTGATPNFGTYSGPGVSGAWFNPATVGVGTYYILYSYLNPSTGCANSVSRTFTVCATPTVSWGGGPINLCLSSGPYALNTGTPVGGTYSGTGVSGNTFDPFVSGTGTFIITYTVTDAICNCTSSTNHTIIVVADPVASWPGGQINMCIDDPADSCFGALPTGGVYSGPGVVQGMMYPMQAGPGLHTITYTYTQPLTNCIDQVTKNYFIDECTGIENSYPDNLNIYLYSNQLHLEFSYPTDGNTTLSVYTILGQEIFKGTIPGNFRSYILPINKNITSILLVRIIGNRINKSIRVLHGQ